MTTPTRTPFLAPFRQRSFRFQWPADLTTSWAFEMETIILGWYVLTETGSVIWLTAFAALQFVGTLISPMYGVMGDRLGHRRVLVVMRAAYALLAATIALLAFTGALSVAAVFAVTLVAGLVRPSDMGMRNALIAATMPPGLLMGALSIERTSSDTARVIGALTGAALAVAMGMAVAYVVVACLYVASLLLMLGVADPRPQRAAAAGFAAPFRELAEGVAHVRATPPLMAGVALAFLANLAAYPLTSGLLPHVARDVYGLDQTGLSWLMASFAGGALAGSLWLGLRGGRLPPARTALVSAIVWFAALIAFAAIGSPVAGMAMLFVIGAVQSFCIVPLSVMILRVAQDGFRGRVMGLRMLAVYGLPVGLLLAGVLVARIGFGATTALYAGFGLACTLAILLFWRAHLWPASAPANARPPG